MALWNLDGDCSTVRHYCNEKIQLEETYPKSSHQVKITPSMIRPSKGSATFQVLLATGNTSRHPD
ncbi:hypothetical protein DAPPUDRAFT_267902 [Daphnia pulex]|uniref:Uncharacterized protein n=1 Tax=Daphnia pulex TaxID=6669 RepID=E9HX34_DAPPU|nr:hypothetical protein DAPPUDRAFT_267902 [Daphnia pulex]|eukprot:EFX63697.1 hypothetical protein DAPPUDRAFT_267902 [Daphnia pulex]